MVRIWAGRLWGQSLQGSLSVGNSFILIQSRNIPTPDTVKANLPFLFPPYHCLQTFFFWLKLSQIIRSGFPDGTVVKNLPANSGDRGDAGLIPGLGRSPGVGNGNPLQYPCLENPWTEESGGLQSMRSQSWAWLSRLTHAQKGIIQKVFCISIKILKIIFTSFSYFFNILD